MTDASRQRLDGWLKFAFGALVTVLGAWWCLNGALSERPTRPVVRNMIDDRRPHKELTSKALDCDKRLHLQQLQLERIEQKTIYIGETVGEIKQKLNSKRGR